MVYYYKLLSLTPFNDKVISKLSNLLLLDKQYDTVINLTQQYLEQDSTNLIINPIYGLALHLKGNYPLSHEVFTKQLELDGDSLLGQGKSVKEAIRDFYESRDELKNHYNELNREFPDIEFHFKYDMASFLEYYSGVLTLAGLERLTGINQGQLSHYVTGHRKPSAKTVLKIEQSIHSFSKELSQVNFV